MRSALFFMLFLTLTAKAQEPMRFQWKAGSTITTNVAQKIDVDLITRDPESNQLVASESRTKLKLTKQWTIADVDKAGTATMSLRIIAFRQEIERPGPLDKDKKTTVEKIVVDSSTPEGKTQTASYLNKPIVTVKLDSRGQVLDAKSELGSVAQLTAELPFRIILPETTLKVGQSWTRKFALQLDPPMGTGEKYPATQVYKLNSWKPTEADYIVITDLNPRPKSESEYANLVPMLWSGSVTFNPSTGQMLMANLTAAAFLNDYQGKGTKFHYHSTYDENVVSAK